MVKHKHLDEQSNILMSKKGTSEIMLKKIISGGQTGVDRAALDSAIKFNIEYGGWIPEGRKAEDGKLPEKYQMNEMPTDSYPKRTEQNIIDSHGTIIISRGNLTGGSLLTSRLASKLKKPCCHINLIDIDEFEATIMINSFIQDYDLEIINFAGPRASIDPFIYNSVRTIFEAVIYMMSLATEPDDLQFKDFLLMERKTKQNVKTINKAVEFLANTMHLKTKSYIANTHDTGIASIYFSMLDYIKVKLGLDSGNEKLLNECAEKLETDFITIEDAVMVILKELKAFLMKDHVLRVV